ncbi:MAG: SH3 domain-containing protein [Rhodobacteraceae bacterium]|nr:SH3 domain-containing protein [Paracoccaceae bacterium]
MRALLRGLVAAACLFAAPLSAQDIEVDPDLYRVSGVAFNDVLNIRQEPTAASPIIGALSPDATGVEVIATASGWGMVNSGEGHGWVSMRYMTREGDWVKNHLPKGLSCYGTEPFWNFGFGDTGTAIADWSLMGWGSGPVVYYDVWTGSAQNRGQANRGFTLAGDAVDAAGAIRTEYCSDGMSDRAYGFAVDVILKRGADGMMVSGCCSLSN